MDENYFKCYVEIPLLELLSYPRLLLDRELCELFVCTIKQFPCIGSLFETNRRKLPGVYLLLVHPDKAVGNVP